MKASVSQLNALAGWWRRPSGGLLAVRRYVSEQGRRYPRESVVVSMYKPDGEPLEGGCGSITATQLRRLLEAMEYAKIGDENTPLAEVLAR